MLIKKGLQLDGLEVRQIYPCDLRLVAGALAGTESTSRRRTAGGVVVGVHRNELLARRDVELASQGDIEGLRRLYTEDCVFHYPGRNPLAGAHRGLSAFVTRLEEVFSGATITRELHDALGTDDHAVQLLRVTATVGSRSHTWDAVWVMNVQNGQFSEAWAHFDDQYALDGFLNAVAGLHTRPEEGEL